MTPLLLTATVLSAMAAAGAVGWVVSRRRQARRAQSAMRRRLGATYAAASRTLDTLPLRAPAGQVAADAEALYLSLGPDPGEPDLRVVPWSEVRQINAVGGGVVAVHVARVGEVHVPGALGRVLWERKAETQRA